MRRLLSLQTSPTSAALLVLISAATLFARQQDPKTAVDAGGASAQQPETSSQTNPTFTFESQRNLVIVRVLVFDARGRTVGNLTKEDFQLYDDGKPQKIIQFSEERSGAEAAAPGGEVQPAPEFSAPEPRRFLGLFFDDVHMQNNDVMEVRSAAEQFLTSSLKDGDRVGIFTSSGQGNLDFTHDRVAIGKAISHLIPRPSDAQETNPCPRIYPYQAFQMINERDTDAIQEAVLETLQCRFDGNSRFLAQAQGMAETQAYRVLEDWQSSSEDVLREVANLVRRMSTLPGQRNIVMVSPGFLTMTKEFDIDRIVDRALRSNITIGTLDSRGLAVESPFQGINEQTVSLPGRSDLIGHKALSKISQFQFEAVVLQTLAQDTGGFYFRNNNDLLEGFRKTASLAPDYYTLAFSPQPLKENGRFHHLKVDLQHSKGLTIEARKGYFAPSKSADAAEQARDEIQQAVFSENQVLQLPIDVHTQFFMMDQHDARLSVLTHLDLRPISFDKKQGRNLNNLTFVTALFDRDGHYVTGKETHINFHLLDISLQKLMSSGLTVKDSFSVKPGIYLIRQVVRDESGGQISGINRTVEIPN